MNKKKLIKLSILFVALIAVIILIVIERAQTKYNVLEQDKQQSIPVEVFEVKASSYDETLNYIGAISAEQVQTLSFKSPGKIQTIAVEEGDFVEKGMVIAKLDTSDLMFEIQAAKKAMEAAYAQYQLSLKGATSQELEQARLAVEKADQVYAFKKETLEEYEVLYATAVISKKEYEQMKLETQVALNDYNTAIQVYETAKNGAEEERIELYYHQYEQAKTDYEYKQTGVDDATLTATVDGTVIGLPYEENTLVPAGQPVVNIRQEGANILIGVTDKDYEKIEVNQPVIVQVNDEQMQGRVLRKKNIPDRATHLYNVEIYLEEKNVLIGKIVECKIIIGKKEGIMIPIQSAIVNGESYVYIYDEGKARRRTIKVEDFIGDQIIVSGLESGELLIVSNAKKVADNKAVTISGEERQDD